MKLIINEDRLIKENMGDTKPIESRYIVKYQHYQIEGKSIVRQIAKKYKSE